MHTTYAPLLSHIGLFAQVALRSPLPTHGTHDTPELKMLGHFKILSPFPFPFTKQQLARSRSPRSAIPLFFLNLFIFSYREGQNEAKCESEKRATRSESKRGRAERDGNRCGRSCSHILAIFSGYISLPCACGRPFMILMVCRGVVLWLYLN